MLSLNNISFTVGKSSILERKILNNLSIQIQDGEFVIIIGSNGAGKSSLFNLISGLLQQDCGQIILNGQDTAYMKPCYRATLVAKVMQDPRCGTMENMTIFENMAFAFKCAKHRGLRPFFNKADRQFFQQKLQMLNMGLENIMDELVINLSGGQRQALSLIMSILTDAKILLLDEITAALDPVSSDAIMRLTAKIIKEEKRTCVMITHNMQHAIDYGDRLLLLKDGYIIKDYNADDKRTFNCEDITMHFIKSETA